MILESSELNSHMVVNNIDNHLTSGEADSVFIPSSFIPMISHNGHPRRHHKLPKRYIDLNPEGPAALPVPIPTPKPAQALPRVILHVKDMICTVLNSFRLMRKYPHRPSYDPDGQLSVEELSNINPAQVPPVVDDVIEPNGGGPGPSQTPPWLFANMTIYHLMHWFNSGSHKKSVGETERLVWEVIFAEDFDAQDLAGFKVCSQNKIFDASEGQTPYSGNGWMESSVDIRLPAGVKGSETEGKTFTVSGLHY